MIQNQDGKSFLNKSGNYNELTDKQLEIRINDLLEIWNDFLIDQEENLKPNVDYFIHKRNLYEVIKRLDKRKTYYYVFHNIKETCEYKDVAIVCYWINTLKPFMVVNDKSNLYNCPNEMFSVYIILSTLAVIFKQKFPNKTFSVPDDSTLQDYVYNFKYCDMSREATIFFVETLAKSYGIGMETNIVQNKYMTSNE